MENEKDYGISYNIKIQTKQGLFFNLGNPVLLRMSSPGVAMV